MRKTRVWARLLGLQGAVVEGVDTGSEGEVVVTVRPHRRELDRCGICRRRSPGFDLGEGRRRWRALDLGTTIAYLEADAPRVSWRSVGRVCERVAEEAGRDLDLLAGLRRIGIDEIFHRKGQRYLTVVVDHDTGRLIWAAPGRGKKTVEASFDALGEKRCRRLKLVSCDMAGWISGPIAERCPKAKRCVDPFHVVGQWVSLFSPVASSTMLRASAFTSRGFLLDPLRHS